MYFKQAQSSNALEIANTNINQIGTNDYNLLTAHALQTFNIIWSSPEYTPQGIMDSRGTGAGQMFVIFGKLQELLVAIDPSYVPLSAPYAYTINQDGTVTIGEKITP